MAKPNIMCAGCGKIGVGFFNPICPKCELEIQQAAPMRADHGPHARKELRDTVGWPMATLRYELAYQQSLGVHTVGPGRCGHVARGSGFCAGCLQAEIDRRTNDARKALGGGE